MPAIATMATQPTAVVAVEGAFMAVWSSQVLEGGRRCPPSIGLVTP
jgi:hypothetical protein